MTLESNGARLSAFQAMHQTMSDGWVKTDRGWRKSYGPAPEYVAPGNFPCPRVMSDTMDPTEHVDGKHYDSKSAYRAVTKAHGYVEVGNDPARLRPQTKPTIDKAQTREAVKQAAAQVLGA